MTTRTTDNIRAPREREREENLPGTETKAAFKTTELIVYVLAVLGVLIASMIVDQSFGADPAWRYVTYLMVGYLISRGLAKSGSPSTRGLRANNVLQRYASADGAGVFRPRLF